MGDVYLIRLVGVLGAARAVTVIVRGDGVAGGWLFLAGAVLAVAGASPWFMAAGATCCSLAMEHPTGSVVLFAWVAALCALFDGEDLRSALRWQVVVVYGFAVVHKVISPAFTSGDIITAQLPALPHPNLAALGVVFLESFLAVAMWRRWPIALPVAVVAHASFVAGMSQNPVHAVALSAFNVHICLLIWWLLLDDGDPVLGRHPLVQPCAIEGVDVRLVIDDHEPDLAVEEP